MIVLITGVSCVGKTAVGGTLAKLLGVPFEDLDQAVEQQLGAPISRLQARYGTMNRYREAAAGVLASRLRTLEGQQAVIALPPSGLMGPYWRQLKGQPAVTVVMLDKAENILERITFYDDDSHPIQKTLTNRERTLHLREIRRDMAYFARSYRKADLRVDVNGCSVADAATRIRDALLDVMKRPGGELVPYFPHADIDANERPRKSRDER
jgi:shikimate kinase